MDERELRTSDGKHYKFLPIQTIQSSIANVSSTKEKY